jgi:hypothetical protein
MPWEKQHEKIVIADFKLFAIFNAGLQSLSNQPQQQPLRPR